MLNSVTIMGRLVADPELRSTANGGVKLVRVRIACDRDRAKDGKREADFITIVGWRKTAEFLAKYFKKGSAVIVCGRLENRNWTDKDGNKRSEVEVVINDGCVYFGDSKRPSSGAPAVPAESAASDFAVMEDDDAQLPF